MGNVLFSQKENVFLFFKTWFIAQLFYFFFMVFNKQKEKTLKQNGNTGVCMINIISHHLR